MSVHFIDITTCDLCNKTHEQVYVTTGLPTHRDWVEYVCPECKQLVQVAKGTVAVHQGRKPLDGGLLAKIIERPPPSH